MYINTRMYTYIYIYAYIYILYYIILQINTYIYIYIMVSVSWGWTHRMDLMIVMSIGRSPDRGSMPIDRSVYMMLSVAHITWLQTLGKTIAMRWKSRLPLLPMASGFSSRFVWQDSPESIGQSLSLSTIWRYTMVPMWRFPEIGVPQLSSILFLDFPRNKPSSYWVPLF